MIGSINAFKYVSFSVVHNYNSDITILPLNI